MNLGSVDSASDRYEYQGYLLGVLRWPVLRVDNIAVFMC